MKTANPALKTDPLKVTTPVKELLRAHSRNLGEARDELLHVSGVLRDDVTSLLDAFNEDWSIQPMRRALVRASWAHIEGTVFAVKRLLLRACDLGGVDLSARDREFLSELLIIVDSAGNAKLESKWFDTLSNIKRTFKLAASRFDLDWRPDFGTGGWEQLTQLLHIRHRLTHPKSVKQLDVKDSEAKIYREAFAFVGVFNEFQSSMLRRYNTPQT
jgi:hypothetical protein